MTQADVGAGRVTNTTTAAGTPLLLTARRTRRRYRSTDRDNPHAPAGAPCAGRRLLPKRAAGVAVWVLTDPPVKKSGARHRAVGPECG
ncbi:hypothetical protein ACFVXQ_25235, partial [Kitasatospora sp. NPDC058263]